MTDTVILLEAAEAALRWLHVITGVAWIGSSFYFIALDLGLRRPSVAPDGVSGERWQVHGGGFYHIQKYTVAPPALPERLVWFKWESYSTWLSGFVLLVWVYYAGAELYLVDHVRRPLAEPVAIALSLVSLVLGWLVYDRCCRAMGSHDGRLMIVVFLLLTMAGWLYSELFTGRAALLHLGALAATFMSANVFFVIIPNQKRLVADLEAGRTPDAALGRVAKQRSTHNNYLTLPVLFLMLSSHYPLIFANPYNWLIASLVFALGAVIRHFFNSRHAGVGSPWWTWMVAVLLFAAMVGLSQLGTRQLEPGAAATPGPSAAHFLEARGGDEVQLALLMRCVMCHGEHANWPGLNSAARAVWLDSPERIAIHARAVYLQAGMSDAMPPGNRTHMTPAERAAIVTWYRDARARKGRDADES